jgi:hypothetical protein
MDLSTWTKRVVNVTKLFNALWEVLVLPDKFGLSCVEDNIAGKNTPNSLFCIYYSHVLRSGTTKQSFGELCKSKKGQSVILFISLKISGGPNLSP